MGGNRAERVGRAISPLPSPSKTTNYRIHPKKSELNSSLLLVLIPTTLSSILDKTGSTVYISNQ
jgi:hypothetical protein